MITSYHAKYYADELTHQGGVGDERSSRYLFDTAVNLNPHQIEAALFAVRSPVSKGVLPADEVGLGKTIEAGIVLCEYWAERKMQLLVIVPHQYENNGRWNWKIEFNLPTIISDAKSYQEKKSVGKPMPICAKSVVITSLKFESKFAEEIMCNPLASSDNRQSSKTSQRRTILGYRGDNIES